MTNLVISGQRPEDTFTPTEGNDFELDYRGFHRWRRSVGMDIVRPYLQ